MYLNMWLWFLFVISICEVTAQPMLIGLSHEVPIDAQCLAFFQRQARQLPINLESRDLGQLTQNNLARHHIIPADTFLRFFNAAVTLPIDRNNAVLSGIMNLMGFLSQAVLNLYPDNGNNHDINVYIRYRIQALRDLQLQYVEYNLNPPLTTLFEEAWLVQSMFQWIPGNIFIGPAPGLRSDDPRNAFEENSVYIVGEEDYRQLVAINRTMNSFIRQPTVTHTERNDRNDTVQVTYNNYAEFNEVMELLSALTHTRSEPYPFDASQWDHNEVTGKYSIRRQNNRERRSILLLSDYDPLCLRPLLTIKRNIQNYNLMIVAKAVERVRKASGFVKKENYNSWRDWYTDNTWSKLYEIGLDMTAQNTPPVGYVFKDKSFVVGVSGTDTKNENDNWVTVSSQDFRESEPREYAGQAIFDKNGRPVAIVITSDRWSNWGSGYSFVYNNGKWEYESTDSWDTRRFSDSTFSLDWHSPKFLIN